MSRPWRCVAVPRVKRTTDRRNRELAQIHIAAQQLGLDRDTYETVLWTVARVRSAAELDAAGRARILEHFRALGWRPHKRGRPRPSEDRAPLIAKIDAMLGERPRTYADGIAHRMFGIRRLEWCAPDQLRKIVAALAYDQRRREAR